jgi:hypothetical protein
MTKIVTLVAAVLLALASLTAAYASIPPRDPPASEARTDANAPTQANDKVALMPRDCGSCD